MLIASSAARRIRAPETYAAARRLAIGGRLESAAVYARPLANEQGEIQLTRILVDGDACPVKDEVYQVAMRYAIPVVLVANTQLRAPDDVAMIVVGADPDAADDWIAQSAQPGDIVVTADIPLAARCLDTGAHALGTTGREFTESSIGDALASRDLSAHLREIGVATGGPRPLLQKDRSRFLSKLDELVQRAQREQ